MAQAALSIGSKVRVLGVRYRFLPASLVESLKADPTGTVTGFRMTDGTGVGVVVELAKGGSSWFFADEVAPA
jgi:hypothetical protein